MALYRIPVDMNWLVFEGESGELFHHIWLTSQSCEEEAQSALNENEIDAQDFEQIQTVLEEELNEAKEFRFSLATADNRLTKERKRLPALQQYFDSQGQAGRKERNQILAELLSKTPPKVDAKVLEEAQSLKQDFNYALRLRIKMTWSWDEIFQETRTLLLVRIKKMGRRLLQIAVQLNDVASQQLVQEILLSLELRAESENAKYDLPDDTTQLQEELQHGIAELNRVYESIIHLDQNRQNIQKTQNQLKQQINRPYLSRFEPQGKPAPSTAKLPASRESHRMIYGDQNEK